MVVAILGVITLNAQIFISGQLIENNGSGIGIPSQTISIQTQGLVLGTAVTNNSGMFYFADSSFSCSMLTDITFSAIVVVTVFPARSFPEIIKLYDLPSSKSF